MYTFHRSFTFRLGGMYTLYWLFAFGPGWMYTFHRSFTFRLGGYVHMTFLRYAFAVPTH